LAILQPQLLGRIDLPDVVGVSGLVEAGGRPNAARRARGPLPPQPALEGALTGQGQLGLGPPQLDADVAGPPPGVLLPQGEDEVLGRVGGGGPARTGSVARGQVIGLLAEAL